MADEFDYKAELLAIDGIGPAKAKEIMAEYKTPDALADAIEKEKYEGPFLDELTALLFDEAEEGVAAEAAEEEPAEEEAAVEEKEEAAVEEKAAAAEEPEPEPEEEAPKPAAKKGKAAQIRKAEVRSNFTLPIVISTKTMYARWPERGATLEVPEYVLRLREFKEHQKRGHLQIIRVVAESATK